MADRLWAAMQMSEHPDIAAALEAGVAVPRSRLRPNVLERIGEPASGEDFVLTDDLVVALEARLNGDAVPTDAPIATHSWSPIDVVAAAADPPPPPTIGGLVYPGRKHVSSGEPETGKTWAALILAADQIQAGESVLFLDFEMTAAAQLDRLRALGLTDEEIASRFLYVAPSEPMTQPDIQADVTALLKTRRPTLVVVDAFTGVLEIHGCSPDSGLEVERFYRTVIAPLSAEGAAVVLLDHVTKNKDTRGRWSIGSERKIGRADVALGFEQVQPFGRGRTGLVAIRTHKDRYGHLTRPKAAELELASDGGTGRVEWQFRHPQEQSTAEVSRSTFRPTTLMERVCQYVASCETAPSQNVVEQNVMGQAKGVRQAIVVLVAEGYLKEIPGSRNGRYFEFVKHYRQSDDPTAT